MSKYGNIQVDVDGEGNITFINSSNNTIVLTIKKEEISAAQYKSLVELLKANQKEAHADLLQKMNEMFKEHFRKGNNKAAIGGWLLAISGLGAIAASARPGQRSAPLQEDDDEGSTIVMEDEAEQFSDDILDGEDFGGDDNEGHAFDDEEEDHEHEQDEEHEHDHSDE